MLTRSGLSERRQVSEFERMQQMLERADLIATCRDGEKLVGIARAVTDFVYCCYLSDLAVDRTYQKQGIGQELIKTVKAQLHPKAVFLLLSAPAAAEYYPKIGFRKLENAWALESDISAQ